MPDEGFNHGQISCDGLYRGDVSVSESGEGGNAVVVENLPGLIVKEYRLVLEIKEQLPRQMVPKAQEQAR